MTLFVVHLGTTTEIQSNVGAGREGPGRRPQVKLGVLTDKIRHVRPTARWFIATVRALRAGDWQVLDAICTEEFEVLPNPQARCLHRYWWV